MPRKPTGRPAGRPPGTGHLDHPERITVALPAEMMLRLVRYSHGRKLAACVRELLDHALTCPTAPQQPSRQRARKTAGVA
jgi:hypothetical protein